MEDEEAGGDETEEVEKELRWVSSDNARFLPFLPIDNHRRRRPVRV